MKKFILLSFLLTILSTAYSDTIGKYASIAKEIPKARLTADPKSQAWARSARSILNVTEETLAQTIQSMQALASKHNTPLLCLPAGQQIDNNLIHHTLEQLVNNFSPKDADKSISQAVIEQLEAQYPCNQHAQNQQRYNNPAFYSNNKDYQMESMRR